MTQLRRSAKNSAVLIVGTILNRLSFLVFFSLLARSLPQEEVGDFYFLFTISSLFTIFSNFGLDVLTVREVAKRPEEIRWYYSNVALIKIVLSLFSVGATYLYLSVGGYSETLVSLGVVSAFLTLANTSIAHTDSLYRGLERFEFSAAAQVINAVMILLGGLLLIHPSAHLQEIMLFFVSVHLVTAILSHVPLLVRWQVRIGAIDFLHWRHLLKMSYPFIITSAIQVVYFRVDVLILSQMLDNYAVASYGAAAKIIESYGILPSILVASIYPTLSRQFENSRLQLQHTATIAIRYLLIVGVPISLFSFAAAPKIIDLFYGEKFVQSVQAFQVLCFRAFSVFVTTLLGHLLFSANRQRTYMQFSVVVLLLNVLLNVLLIPRFGFLGPAIAFSISTAIGLFFHVYYAQKHVCPIQFGASLWKPFIVSVPVALLLHVSPFPLVVDIGVSLILFWIGIIMVKGLSDLEMRALKQLLKERG